MDSARHRGVMLSFQEEGASGKSREKDDCRFALCVTEAVAFNSQCRNKKNHGTKKIELTKYQSFPMKSKKDEKKNEKNPKKILAMVEEIPHNKFIRSVDAVGNQPAPPQVLTVAER